MFRSVGAANAARATSSPKSATFDGFTGVDVGGAFKVEIVAGKEYSVEVEADDNLVPLVRTQVEDGMLKIETEKRISSKSELKIRITAPDIDSLESSGVSASSFRA